MNGSLWNIVSVSRLFQSFENIVLFWCYPTCCLNARPNHRPTRICEFAKLASFSHQQISPYRMWDMWIVNSQQFANCKFTPCKFAKPFEQIPGYVNSQTCGVRTGLQTVNCEFTQCLRKRYPDMWIHTRSQNFTFFAACKFTTRCKIAKRLRDPDMWIHTRSQNFAFFAPCKIAKG